MLAKVKKYWFCVVVLGLLSFLTSCQASRHVPKGKYLLQSRIQVQHDKDLSVGAMESAIDTKPNKRILLPKLYLHFYNLGKTMELDSSWVKSTLMKVPRFNRFFNQTTNWLTLKIGEPPALLDITSLKQDSVNLFNYSFANGYLQPDISYQIDTIENIFTHQRARVKFMVKGKSPYIIDQINYRVPEIVEDSLLIKSGLLKVGQRYQHQNFAKERSRLTNYLRDIGYFSFSQKAIRFEVDTLSLKTEVLENTIVPVKLDVIIDSLPIQYKIREVDLYIRPPGKNLQSTPTKLIHIPKGISPDSVQFYADVNPKKYKDSLPIGFHIHPSVLEDIDFDFLANRISFLSGEHFSQTEARKTQQSLQELGMIQFVLVSYTEVDSIESLDVKVEIQLASRYQLKLGFETFSEDITTASNLPSLGANMSWRNKNAFGKSELFDWKLGGNIGFYSTSSEQIQETRLAYEFATSFDFRFPWLVIPFLKGRNFGALRPQTSLTGSFRSENFQEYERNSTGFQVNYRWYHAPFQLRTFSQLTPLAFDFINTSFPEGSTFFEDVVLRLPTSIQRDYQPNINTRFLYSLTHTTFGTSSINPTYFLKGQLEFGGNMIRLLDELFPVPEDRESAFTNAFRGRFTYAQYLKASFEGKYDYPFDQRNNIVLRGFLGVSGAYGGASLVPQERRFFSGGTRSMRGWQSNTLGPGTMKLEDFFQSDTVNFSLAAPGGEIIFELNAEYRVDLGSYLELAVFTDWGNVWFNGGIDNSTEGVNVSLIEDGILSRDNLKLGWDAGFGLRFDFSFLILRCDIGQQLYAPDRGWVINQAINGAGFRFTQLNLGIGYPF